MKEKTHIVRCQNCGTKNRILRDRGRTPFCGKCKQKLGITESPVTITDQNFGELVGNAKLPVLLDLWATWCPPCRMLAPIIEQLATELAGKALVGKLDVDNNKVTAASFGVQSIPTMLILKDGQEVDRMVGLQSKDAILQRLNKYM